MQESNLYNDLQSKESKQSFSEGLLYKLPKDMLVKLISTIRADTIKECEERLNSEEILVYQCIYCRKYYNRNYKWNFYLFAETHHILIDCVCNKENCLSQYKSRAENNPMVFGEMFSNRSDILNHIERYKINVRNIVSFEDL